MRPGITGLWQVSGRNKLPYAKRVELDAYYVSNWSLWLDIKILFKTVRTVITGDGSR
jgi:lipopolysaccharide/colanic/teichoic acid biosynthesis glycosyltransferase